MDFTRKHEKEADRIGLSILLDAGFEPQGMSTFFERLQRAGRFHENGTPSYLRTHPITYERIADIQNRIREMPYRQVPDSIDFLLVRAKLRAMQGKPHDSVVQFKSRLDEKRDIPMKPLNAMAIFMPYYEIKRTNRQVTNSRIYIKYCRMIFLQRC